MHGGESAKDEGEGCALVVGGAGRHEAREELHALEDLDADVR